MTSFTVQHISSNQPISAGRLPSNVARIFNIQRYSLNDGGGIRTVVFFKGCPHTCPWCANPESISNQIHIIRREAKCLHCQPCLNNADECPATAMERTGGGVTLSGGEVLMQAPFALQLLTQLKHLGINTAIETAGDTSLTAFLELAKQCDSILFDLKIMDKERAKNLLNMHQPRVLRNFTRLIEEGITLIPRVPLIPGHISVLGPVQTARNPFTPVSSVWRSQISSAESSL